MIALRQLCSDWHVVCKIQGQRKERSTGRGGKANLTFTDHAHGIGLHIGLCSTHAPSFLGICTRSALAAENSSLVPGEKR